MSIKSTVVATATAVVAAFAFSAVPASAEYNPCYLSVVPCYPPKGNPPKTPKASSTGKFVVGCIMGSAAGLIFASIVKGGGLKLMTQKEWEDLKVKVPNPLTNDEAMLVASTCGLAAFTIRPGQVAAVVRAGG
jgi:hypothetical protein